MPIQGIPSQLFPPLHYSLATVNLLREQPDDTNSFKIRKKYAITVLCHSPVKYQPDSPRSHTNTFACTTQYHGDQK